MSFIDSVISRKQYQTVTRILRRFRWNLSVKTGGASLKRRRQPELLDLGDLHPQLVSAVVRQTANGEL